MLNYSPILFKKILLQIVLLFFVWNNAFCAEYSLKTTTKWDGVSPSIFIATIIINGHEYNQQVYLAKDSVANKIYIDLNDIVRVLNIKHQQTETEIELITPIGSGFLSKKEVKNIDSRIMLSLDNLSKTLAVSVHFDQSSFALIAEVSWFEETTIKPKDIIEPNSQSQLIDIHPQSASLSYLTSEYFYRHGNNTESTFSQTETGGNFLSGAWQLRLRNYINDSPVIENYLWYRNSEKQRWLVGNSAVSLNRLLGGFDFTGIQTAWANNSIQEFTNNIQNEQLLSNQSSAVRTFKGQGIAGGLVELRIEGQKIATTITRLDKVFIFRDIKLPSFSYIQIEAWVFEPNIDTFPLKIIDLSRYNNNRNLSTKTFLIQAGVGQNGNLLEQGTSTLDNAFFTSAQYAVSDNITLESISQSVGDEQTNLIGARSLIGKLGYLQTDIAFNNGKVAWRYELLNRQKNWFSRASSQHLPEKWQNSLNAENDDSYAELGWFNKKIELSLINRNSKSENSHVSYTLPAIRWRPLPNLNLSSRPDQNGDYSSFLTWQISKKQSFNALASKREKNLLWQYRLSHKNRIIVQHTKLRKTNQRSDIIFNHSRARIKSIGYSLGILFGKNHTGYLAHIDYDFSPSVRLRAQIIRDPLLSEGNQRLDTVFGLNISTNFNIGKHGLSHGGFHRELSNDGSLSGIVNLPELITKEYNLENISILINGQTYAKTNAKGEFIIPYLNNGIYEIKLDLDNLPIELAPIKDSYWVKIIAGSNTEVQFNTQALYGISGMVENNVGEKIPVNLIEIRSFNGEVMQQAYTNNFGKFRFYGLKPQTYIIRTTVNKINYCDTITLKNNFIIKKIFTTSTLCENHEN